MPEFPLISIITVCLNDLEGLKRTMNSVFEQTYQGFEYIIIDGNSSDGSREYIAANQEKIAYWVSESDTGIYNGMNKGIEAASGEYLLFLNSGDFFLNENVLEENHTELNKHDIIYFDLEMVNGIKKSIKRFPDRLNFTYFISDSLGHQSTFIAARLFIKYGCYDENFLIVSDWKFFLETICKFNASYRRIDRVLSVHHLDGISAVPENWPVIIKERNQVLEKDFMAFIDEIREKIKLEQVLSGIKRSKKIRLMIWLGLLNRL